MAYFNPVNCRKPGHIIAATNTELHQLKDIQTVGREEMERTVPVIFADLFQFPKLSCPRSHGIDDKERVITDNQIEEGKADHGA